MKSAGFKPVSPKIDFPKLEEEILKYWKENKIFEKSLEKRRGGKKFTFYDGPPFATGLPHYGHILPMSIKDAITRYKTMQGYYVPRRLGWDCHGLPVEYEVEKELKISGKKQIEEMGIDKFCEACRNIVFRYTTQWGTTIDRMGRWADKENSYATLDLDYMESILWVFKQIWDKGLIYKDFKSMPYCPRCATPLSNFETNQGYKDNIEDPSVYVKFELVDEPKTYFLAWTTTPWTLPGNVALALNPKIKYAKVKVGNEILILAKDRIKEVLKEDFEVISEIKAKELAGKSYKPIYQFLPIEKNKKAFITLDADFVGTEDGTGIVHIAPAFGEDDLELAKKENLGVIQTVNERGEFDEKAGPFANLFVKKADKPIIEDLKTRGFLYREETILHTYPFCWRCDTPLIYYAISTWFIRVSALRSELVLNNNKIHWMPAHVKEGRFGKWLSQARDWAISRNRFWGAPIPLWQCDKCQKYICIGSLKELSERKIGNDKITDLHRPFIDKIKIKCDCGGAAQRVSEVLDCWFESGSMPYAQDHYPFENKEEFEKNFPADFIAEGLDQTRGWFYTLHVLASILFKEPAFKNCIVNGIILDSQGKKLSKRLRNYPEPEEIFDKYGADSLRFLLLSSPAALADELRISDEIVSQVSRKVFLILWNVYNFFVTYANIDQKSEVRSQKSDFKSQNVLDRWIVSRLNQTIKDVTSYIDNYNLPKSLNSIADFIYNDLSTWYLRRSRSRVGPIARDASDKNEFYQTCYEVLIVLCKLLAPFAPFLVDSIYRNLTNEESVHLSDWPEINSSLINGTIEGEMLLVRKICELGHAKRKENQIKVRQPLSEFRIQNSEFRINEELINIIKDELNVKKIIQKEGKGELSVELDTKVTPELKAEGEAREIVRKIQEERKKLQTALDEKIDVVLPDWPERFTDYIKKEALVNSISKGEFSVRKS